MDSKEGLQALFDYATEGILVVDGKGDIIRANPAIQKLFGYAQGELIGQKIEVLIPRRYSNKHVDLRENYTGKPHARAMGVGIDLYGVRKDGSEFPVEVSLSPYTTENSKYIIGFVIDITLRKRAEETLKQKKEEVERLAKELKLANVDLEKRVKERTMILEEAISELNKTKEELDEAIAKERELNELKSRFVSMASHEFRTPLTTILSSLSLATKYAEQNDTEKQMKHINRIKTAVSNLTDILNDVLSISKLEEGKIHVNIEELDIKALATEIVQELDITTVHHIDYTHTGTETISCDAKILRHILLNLLSNAIKFSPETEIIHLNTEVKNNTLHIVVKDKGIGMSEEDQQHLFERFYRAPNAANIQGTGLGLNIVAKYIEMLNGEITCQSKLNQGTTFTIKIPLNLQA